MSFEQWPKEEMNYAAYVNDIMQWLLDEDAVGTQWEPLVNISLQHAQAQ